jgi:hypothetical protein
VIICGDKARIQYRLPVPSDGKETQCVEVLLFEPVDGAEVSIGSTGKEFDLIFSFSI